VEEYFLFMASTFADGIIAAATVIDAQVNYELPKLKSTLKGLQNGGKEYGQVLGAGLIGNNILLGQLTQNL
jgi:hypothetical protein